MTCKVLLQAGKLGKSAGNTDNLRVAQIKQELHGGIWHEQKKKEILQNQLDNILMWNSKSTNYAST